MLSFTFFFSADLNIFTSFVFEPIKSLALKSFRTNQTFALGIGEYPI